MDPSQSSPNSEETLLKAKGRILSTMEEDGSRRWLKPRLSSGKWLSRRRWVAYFLIVVFTALPFVHWQGRPFIKLDLLEREFTIGFVQFLATDTLLLALFLVAFLLTIVFMTALTGRVALFLSWRRFMFFYFFVVSLLYPYSAIF